MKFKVGDKVKITLDDSCDSWLHVHRSSRDYDFNGKVGTIVKVWESKDFIGLFAGQEVEGHPYEVNIYRTRPDWITGLPSLVAGTSFAEDEIQLVEAAVPV